MKQYTQQELNSHYSQLPEVLKDAMFSADVAEKIYQIGERSSFNETQISAMAEETGYLILGVTEPKEFVKNLADRVGVGEDAARIAARELNAQIFVPLREALKSVPRVDAAQAPEGVPQYMPPQHATTPPAMPPPVPAPSQAPKPTPPPPPSQIFAPGVERPAEESTKTWGGKPPPQPAPPPNLPTREPEVEPIPVINQPIDLRRKEIEEMAPPRPPVPFQQPVPPQRPTPPAPPPAPQQPLYQTPVRFIPQVPPSRIPPIDLRNQPVLPQQPAPHPMRPRPQVPPRAPGVDPYREPAQ